MSRGSLINVLLRKLGLSTGHWMVKWEGTRSPKAGLHFLIDHARASINQSKRADALVLTVGGENAFHNQLARLLNKSRIKSKRVKLDQLPSLDTDVTSSVVGIYCGETGVKEITEWAEVLSKHASLSEKPFEYVSGLDNETTLFHQLDEYPDTRFVSPLSLEDPGPFQIYLESLKLFEQKCGLRDYLDLYQVIKNIVLNGVEGDIAEFGSYKGHSGWLIARTLQQLGCHDKKVYLFDAFESFPEESVGIDKFWSKTHQVDFEEVKSKFSAFDNVSFIQGDFTKTIHSSDLGQLSLAHVDCDSYRSTLFLFRTLLDKHLSRHAALVCEDYGHPALLGSRLAVHEAMQARVGFIQYFSQFSGLYVVYKTC